MLRSLLIVFGVFCVATVLSQCLGLILLWSRGQLTAETAERITAILRGTAEQEGSGSDELGPDQPTMQDVVEQRVLRTLDLGAREDELKLLKALVAEKRQSLLAEKTALEKQKREFEAQLQSLRADMNSEATEQARSVLLALRPDAAVSALMQLDSQANIRLLQGMPAKSIGKILTAFQGAGPDAQKRGAEVFKALSEGEPTRSVVDQLAPATKTATASR